MLPTRSANEVSKRNVIRLGVLTGNAVGSIHDVAPASVLVVVCVVMIPLVAEFAFVRSSLVEGEGTGLVLAHGVFFPRRQQELPLVALDAGENRDDGRLLVNLRKQGQQRAFEKNLLREANRSIRGSLRRARYPSGRELQSARWERPPAAHAHNDDHRLRDASGLQHHLPCHGLLGVHLELHASEPVRWNLSGVSPNRDRVEDMIAVCRQLWEIVVTDVRDESLRLVDRLSGTSRPRIEAGVILDKLGI